MSALSIEHAFQVALQHHQAGRLLDAARIYEQIVALQPDHANAVHLLGVAALQSGQVETALRLIDRAIALLPTAAMFHNNRGQALHRLGRTDEAMASYRQAIALDPTSAEAQNNLGNVLEENGQLADAGDCYTAALRLRPDYAEAHTNLGNVLKERGEIGPALEHFRRAIALRPGLSPFHSNLLLALHYDSHSSPAAIAQEHRRWANLLAAPLTAAAPPPPPAREPERRLRIGYVSPDLRDHAVARFLLPLLQHHDRRQFEIFAYADVAKPDAMTNRLRQYVDGWRDIAWRPNAQTAAQVRQDQIDILVDLAAHTANSHLLLFAEKPAPVQVTYLAYCSTTGLDTIDYRISDPFLDPPEADLSHYTEKTVRLETYWCYPAPEAPEAVAPPMPREGPTLTFGCLNNFSKVTDAALRLWARVLHAVPDAELLLHAKPGSHRDRVRDVLRAAGGIAPKRVRFVGKQAFGEYLATYRNIDIALDPIPFAGGTTTCDALWMGVPVISLAGQTAVSRAGSSLLANIGLPELASRTEDDYVRTAVALARDRARLAQLRTSLRSRMLASPLMNAPRFAARVEAAYRTMWREACKAACG